MTQANLIPHARRNDLLPLLDKVQRAPGELIVPARNIRTIEPAHLGEVITSISVLGFCVPVLIDARGGVIDGAVRVEAAKQMGLAAIHALSSITSAPPSSGCCA